MGSTVRTSQSIQLARPRPGRRQILVYLPEYNGGAISDKLLVFGPNYTTQWRWKQKKKEALKHVLWNSTRCSYEELMYEIGSVENEAKAAYLDDTLSNMKGDFREIMAEDGCFFLLVAFSILGAGRELKFPDKHDLFGVGCVEKHLKSWLMSIFFVGNQVPRRILKKLMNYLCLFRKLKDRRNQWNNRLQDDHDHDHELYKRAIRKFLMSEEGQEDDIIHCLQSVLLGESSTTVLQMQEEEEGHHYSVVIPGHQYSDVIPPASLLFEKGVHFQKLKGELGVRSIHYKPCKLFNNPVLYLPCFSVDRYTELMLECLLKYETAQSTSAANIEPEVSSYFLLLRELIPTTKDFEILYSSGVIQGDEDKVRAALFRFGFTATSAHLCRIGQQIKRDTHRRLLPWRKLLEVVCAVLTFLGLLSTYLQAHYTILSYYRNPH